MHRRLLTPQNMTTLICNCNQTLPLQTQPLGRALGEDLKEHTTLCRREAGAFQRAIQGQDTVVVACTQEQRLFAELAEQTEGAVAPIRFVNLRETAGWGADGAQAMPKMAALLAAARLPEPEPVPTVTYKSEGRLLILGPLERPSAPPICWPMCCRSRSGPRGQAMPVAARRGVTPVLGRPVAKPGRLAGGLRCGLVEQ